MGPLLFLFPDDEDDGGGLLEAAEDGRELFFVEERSFIDFILLLIHNVVIFGTFVTPFLCLASKRSADA